ncbi:sigma-70 family RNA polymerase sigma factor [Rossellomorea aquimaris]|uniref:sigma-70 family RNA polymerase sigma factor n=1 Tax=Rossellomorea aquimaris TaxID=189382 RepID=UPI001CD53F61|nr:sigma-70 family RNA polymerase sigma factor [Rossellomorea aquimaris]MCA1058883.1 sigma-70 family RNA polymerase sigma factor [Rossellomorea aquimaris]
MQEKKKESFSEKNRDLANEFNRMIEGFKDGLWRYCRYLTGSPWDGEDLFQDTILKAFGGYYQRWHPTNPKAYLYRMATTTWIDQCRKEKRNVGILEENVLHHEEISNGLEAEEALHILFDLFSPRQVAVFLLKEVFRFDAKEVAGMVRTTPGAVYATVRRMKEKLQSVDLLENSTQTPDHETDPVIKAYLNAINEGDIEAVLALVSDEAHNEAALGFQEYSKDEMRTGSMKFGLPGMRALEYNLWGRSVIVLLSEEGNGPEIHDIQYQEVENGKIVYHVSYYFRKEFIFAAAEELGIPPQTSKPVVEWG